MGDAWSRRRCGAERLESLTLVLAVAAGAFCRHRRQRSARLGNPPAPPVIDPDHEDATHERRQQAHP